MKLNKIKPDSKCLVREEQIESFAKHTTNLGTIKPLKIKRK